MGLVPLYDKTPFLPHKWVWIPYICVNIWDLFFSFWLISLCITGSRFIHLTRSDSNLLFFMLSNSPLCIYIHTHTYRRCREWTVDTVGRESVGRTGKWRQHLYSTMCKRGSWWEAAVWHRKPSLRLCDDLEGWDGMGRQAPDGRGSVFTYGWFRWCIAETSTTLWCNYIPT